MNFARYEKYGVFTQKVEFLCHKIILLSKVLDENWRIYEPENNSIMED
jgi:hypothetical protein